MVFNLHRASPRSDSEVTCHMLSPFLNDTLLIPLSNMLAQQFSTTVLQHIDVPQMTHSCATGFGGRSFIRGSLENVSPSPAVQDALLPVQKQMVCLTNFSTLSVCHEMRKDAILKDSTWLESIHNYQKGGN